MKFSCLPSSGHTDLGKVGGGAVWDANAGEEVKTLKADGTFNVAHKGAVIARFDAKGEFVTKDKAVAARLKELGYRAIEGDEPERNSDASPETGAQPTQKGKWGK